MYRYLTKVFLAGVAAVILTATPANAFHKGIVHGGGGGGGGEDPVPIQTLDSLDCTAGQIARFDGTEWVCSDFLLSLESIIFITSDSISAAMGGVDGADDHCNIHAVAAGLPGEYLAWLADSQVGSAPAVTFFQSPFPYVLPSGIKVADNWADLTDGSLDHAIDENEDGSFVTGEVWTNVAPNGSMRDSTTTGSCNGWTDATGAFRGRVGLASAVNSGWTDTALIRFCSAPKLLYCVGQSPF